MPRPALLCVTSLALASIPAAQAVWTIDAAGSAAQHNGPPAGPCGAPLGPVQALWSYAVPGPCATPGVTAPVLGAGDVGIDRAEDLLWITDGALAAAYQTFGTPILTGVDVQDLLGGDLCTGLDWDPIAGRLWATDGTDVVSATIAFDGVCYDAVFASSFTLPAGAYATALSHDPLTNTLFVVDALGGLTQVTKGGALGPMGSIDVVAASACGLSAPLLGVAVDTAGPAGRIYVTDGTLVAVVDAAAGGVAAAPTAYTPVPCYVPPFTPLEGLAITAVGGLVGSSSGGPFPAIGARGQSIVPNQTFAIEVGGAHAGEVAALVLGTSFLCPAASVAGAPLNVAPPLVLVATKAIDATGFASVPLPLGLGTPIGKTVYVQWGLLDPATFTATSTRAMEMTTSLP